LDERTNRRVPSGSTILSRRTVIASNVASRGGAEEPNRTVAAKANVRRPE